MANILYLLEMGMNDNNITTDIKNHRIRVVNKIDIEYKGNPYNMFFEFTVCDHWRMRYTNKRNGKPLKKAVQETIIKDGLHIDTEYERQENGFPCSFRNLQFENEMWNEHHKFTRADILEVVNRYKIGEKFTDVKLVEETATEIIEKIGGYREKDIVASDHYFGIGETWTDDHKVVKCYKREREFYVGGSSRMVTTRSCEVDLVSGLIVG